uniref:Uncharacterized protein n=1 Tax=Trichuris muris TaxID=70415 RepID=A0A5S6QZW6_TRIMR
MVNDDVDQIKTTNVRWIAQLPNMNMLCINFLLLLALRHCGACKPNPRNGNSYCITTVMNDYNYDARVLSDDKKQQLLYRGVAKAVQFDILSALRESRSSPTNKCHHYQKSHVQCFRRNYDNAIRINVVMETTLAEHHLAAMLKELEAKPRDSTYYMFTQSRVTPGRTCAECMKEPA